MTREEFIEKAKELATDFWTMNLRDGTYESKFIELLDEYEGFDTYGDFGDGRKYNLPVGVTNSLLADFLKYAIDDTMRISGDHDGLAGTTFVGDTYEKIAGDYISICNDRLTDAAMHM